MKIALACGAALLCAVPVSSAAAPAPRGDYSHDEAAIVLVDCEKTRGTAFKVGANTYATALHVVEGPTRCYVGGQEVKVTHIDRERDYATFIGPASKSAIHVNCGGFLPYRFYMARGFPGGGTFNILTPWQATGHKSGGFDLFIGPDSIPGMSGGPIIDSEGRAVGVLVLRYPARAIALSDTGYCKR